MKFLYWKLIFLVSFFIILMGVFFYVQRSYEELALINNNDIVQKGPPVESEIKEKIYLIKEHPISDLEKQLIARERIELIQPKLRVLFNKITEKESDFFGIIYYQLKIGKNGKLKKIKLTEMSDFKSEIMLLVKNLIEEELKKIIFPKYLNGTTLNGEFNFLE